MSQDVDVAIYGCEGQDLGGRGDEGEGLGVEEVESCAGAAEGGRGVVVRVLELGARRYGWRVHLRVGGGIGFVVERWEGAEAGGVDEDEEVDGGVVVGGGEVGENGLVSDTLVSMGSDFMGSEMEFDVQHGY